MLSLSLKYFNTWKIEL